MSDHDIKPRRLAPQESTHMIGADVLRIAACFSVMSIHFLLNIQFYEVPITGAKMYIMLTMRMLFSVCVPLFIMLTGYLMVNRTLSVRHYSKGMKVVWIYLLASLACIIYKLYLRDYGTWEINLKDILAFRAAPYSWYIEMYFGLYLLIPFLNLIYAHLPSKRWKIALIITLLALNSIPKFINSFNFTEPGWWSNPTLSTQYQQLVPRWWYYNTYPLTYYFIGAYLREYGLRLNGILHRVLIVVTLGLSVLFELWRSGGGTFNWGLGSEWDFLLTAILAALIFALIVQKPYRRMPTPMAKVIRYVSGLTLSMFMVSYIFDHTFYQILNEKVPVVEDRLVWYLAVVPAVFLASMVLSVVIDLIYRLISLIGRKIAPLVKSSGAKNIPETPPAGTHFAEPAPPSDDFEPDVEPDSEPDFESDFELDIEPESAAAEPAPEPFSEEG